MKRRKPNQETLTFDDEDVKEKPLMMKKNKWNITTLPNVVMHLKKKINIKPSKSPDKLYGKC